MGTSNDTGREVAHQLAQFSWAKDVPAPVDADGETVPLRTDTLYTHDGDRFCVEGIRYTRDKSYWSVFGHHENPTIYSAYNLRCLHLTKPDSWEKLEEDLDRCIEADCISHGTSLVLEDIKQRIRKLRGDAE